MSADGREATAYRWARRLLIAVGALAVLGILALVAVIVSVEWGRRQPPAREVTSAPDAETFVLGEVTRLAGTPFRRITVARRGGGGGSGYGSSGGAGDDRNIILLDARTGANRRLLPDNQRRIASAHFLPEETETVDPLAMATGDLASPARPGTASPVRFYLLEVARSGGGREVIAGRIEGGLSAVVIPAVDEVASVWMRDADHAAILAFENQRLTFRVVALAAPRASAPVAVEVGR